MKAPIMHMTKKQYPRNSRNVGNKTALVSLSMGLVVISNNQCTNVCSQNKKKQPVTLIQLEKCKFCTALRRQYEKEHINS